MVTRRPHAAILLRVPLDVKDWLEEKAKHNCATKTSEIIRLIRAQMDDEAASKPQGRRARAPKTSKTREAATA
jgi:hypothetical protein